jgi:hypothetical protein
MAERAVALLIIAISSTLLAIGCGSEDGSSEARGSNVTPEVGLPLHYSSLTKAQYLVRANRICEASWTEMVGRFADAQRQQGPNADQAKMFAYSSQTSFLLHMQFWYDDISYLGAPKGDKHRVEEMLKALQLAVVIGEEWHIPNATLYSAIFSTFSRLARQYGLDECVVSANFFESAS